MDEKKYPTPVPYIVYEATLARVERTQRRYLLLVLVTLAGLVVTNACWLVRIFG